MLVKPTMESLLKKVDSRYTLSMLAAKRARQLVNGALPLSVSDTPNFVTLACEEIVKGRIVCVKGIKDIYIPLRPEVAAERLASKAALENARLQEALDESFSRTRIIEIEDDELLEEPLEEIVDEDLSDDLSEDVDVDSLIDKFIPSDDEVVLDILEEDDSDLIKVYTPDEEEK
jgi:DNA-directed RNA polymerase subunit omega